MELVFWIVAALTLPLAWTILLIVLLIKNSNGFRELKNKFQALEKRLDEQVGLLMKPAAPFHPEEKPRVEQAAEAAPAPESRIQSTAASILSPSPPTLSAQAPEQPVDSQILLPLCPSPPLEPVIPLLNSQCSNINETTPPFSVPTPSDLPELNPPPGVTAGPLKPPADQELRRQAEAAVKDAPAPYQPPASEQANYIHLRQPAYKSLKDESGKPRPNKIQNSPPVKINSSGQLKNKPGRLKQALSAALNYLMREGHLWVAAGVLVLFLGAGFLVRYTITMGWFSPGMRLISTFAVGLVLTGAGLAVRRRRRSWALAVQGCGLGLMYLTVVGAVRVYALLGQWPALGLMTALVAVTAGLALRQNSQVVAHLGLVAAFAAPLLVSSGQNNYVGLFSYYNLLNLSILGMCQVRPWRRLYLSGFSLSFSIFGAWLAGGWYRPAMFFHSAPFLALFYLFYVFIGLRAAAGDGLQQAKDDKTGGKNRRLRTDLTLTILAPILFLSYIAVMSEWAYVTSITATVVGLLYLALALALKARYLPALTARIIFWQAIISLNLGLALILFDLGLPWKILNHWTIYSLIFSFEGALLCYIGNNRSRTASMVFGRLSLGLAAIFSLISLILPSGNISMFFFSSLVLGGALMHAAWSELKYLIIPARGLPAGSRRQASLFRESAIAVWTFGIVAGGYQMRQWFDSSAAVSWLLSSGSILVMLLLALGWKVPLLLADGRRKPALGSEPGGYCPLLIQAGILVLLPLSWEALIALVSFLTPWNRFLEPSGSPNAYTLLAWLMAFFVQGLAIKQARRHVPARFRITVWSLALVLVGGRALSILVQLWGLPPAWLEPAQLLPILLSLAVIWWRLQLRVFQDLGLLNVLVTILAGLSLWRFLDMTDDPAAVAGLWSYIPLFNSVDLVQAASCLLPLMALYSLAGENSLKLRRNIIYALGILLFVWLNLVLGRAVHHYAGVPYNFSCLFGSNYFQAAAALVWGVVGISTMITGHRSGRRIQWLLGATLMALDLVKLFLIDLSKADTVTRIISFVVVGLLLIMVGYFAPLPSPENAEQPEAGDKPLEKTTAAKA